MLRLRRTCLPATHENMPHTTQQCTTTLTSAPPAAPARVGLMAGWGRYPLLVVEALRRQGSEVYCLGVVGLADPKLAEICRDFQWSGLGRFGAAIRYFKRHAVSDVIMAGKIHKTLLFKPWFIVRNTPDLRTIRMFIPHFLTHNKDNKDDTLLGAIVEEFAREGMRFGRPTDYAAELLVGKGQLTRREPSARQWKDIRFGWKLAKEMGRLDVGQSVAIKDQAALAIEAAEGTDECIRRAGLLCRAGGFSRGQGRQAAAGHALRRAHRRHEDRREHRFLRRKRAGYRGRPDDPAGRAGSDRFRRPPRAGDRGG